MPDVTTPAPEGNTLRDALGDAGVRIVQRQVQNLENERAFALEEIAEIHASLAAIEELARNAPGGHVTGAYVGGLIGTLRGKAQAALDSLR